MLNIRDPKLQVSIEGTGGNRSAFTNVSVSRPMAFASRLDHSIGTSTTTTTTASVFADMHDHTDTEEESRSPV